MPTTIPAVKANTYATLLGSDITQPASVGNPIPVSTGTGSGTIIDDNGSVLTVLRSFANVNASQTDSNLVTKTAGSKVRVLSMVMVAGGTATASTFNSKPTGGGTAITSLFANAANGGFVLSYEPAGWFESNPGEGLTVTTGAGSATGYTFTYVNVPSGNLFGLITGDGLGINAGGGLILNGI